MIDLVPCMQSFDIRYDAALDASEVVVTTDRGRCFWCRWAGLPTIAQVLQAWREDRRSFAPYVS